MVIADAHGYLETENLKSLFTLFDAFIIHISSSDYEDSQSKQNLRKIFINKKEVNIKIHNLLYVCIILLDIILLILNVRNVFVKKEDFAYLAVYVHKIVKLKDLDVFVKI